VRRKFHERANGREAERSKTRRRFHAGSGRAVPTRQGGPP
jgi:hypothetical protein